MMVDIRLYVNRRAAAAAGEAVVSVACIICDIGPVARLQVSLTNKCDIDLKPSEKFSEFLELRPKGVGVPGYDFKKPGVGFML